MNLIAAVMSFIFPGLGQIKHREYAKGLIIMILWIIVVGINWLYFSQLSTILFYLVFSIYASIDAFVFNIEKKLFEEQQMKSFEEILEKEEENWKEIKAKIEEEVKKQLEEMFGKNNFEIIELKQTKTIPPWEALVEAKNDFYKFKISKEGKIIN